MALQFKCRSCAEGGTIYLPDRGYHVCHEHAPIDERQVPAYSGFEPLSLIKALQRGKGGFVNSVKIAPPDTVRSVVPCSWMADSTETQQSEAELDLLVAGALEAEDRLKTDLKDFGRLNKSDIDEWQRREKARQQMIVDHNAELGAGRMVEARHARARTLRVRAEAELVNRMEAEAREAEKEITGKKGGPEGELRMDPDTPEGARASNDAKRGPDLMDAIRAKFGPEDQAAWNAWSSRITTEPSTTEPSTTEPSTTEPSTTERRFEVDVLSETDAIARMLVEKNQAYGNSALDPLRIFSQADPVEQIRVRIDDKLSRLARGSAAGEDVVQDLMGYLVLLRIAEKRRGPVGSNSPRYTPELFEVRSGTRGLCATLQMGGPADDPENSESREDVKPSRVRCNVAVVGDGMSCQNWAGVNHLSMCNYHAMIMGVEQPEVVCCYPECENRAVPNRSQDMCEAHWPRGKNPGDAAPTCQAEGCTQVLSGRSRPFCLHHSVLLEASRAASLDECENSEPVDPSAQESKGPVEKRGGV